MTGHWTLDDIDWARFDPAAVDPDILQTVKAAALVEANSPDYVAYLCNVFPGDPAFHQVIRQWGAEEAQHGAALAAWAERADPDFDFPRALARFRASYQLPLDATESVRGSQWGELIARCVVETGTSSLYSAMRDAVREPVLKQICHRIASDEYRHYLLFRASGARFRAGAPLGVLARLKIALGRIAETGDDELARAWHSANDPHAPYDLNRYAAAQMRGSMRLYRRHHIRNAVELVLRAVDLNPRGWLAALIAPLAWLGLQWRLRRLARG